MNIDKINNNTNTYQNDNNFKIDSILNGKIKALENDKYNIEFDNNIKILIPEDLIKGEVGEKVSFKVLDNKNSLKQIIEEKNNNLNIPKNEIYIKKNTEKNNTLNLEKNQVYSKFLQENSNIITNDNITIISKIKNKIKHIENVTTDKSIEFLLKKGINPQKLDVEKISDFLKISIGEEKENKKNSEEKSLIELKEEKSKNMKMDLNMNGTDEEDIFRYENILEKAGASLTDRNLENIKNLEEKFENIKNLDKNTIFSAIKKETNTTIEDLYTAKHSISLNNNTEKNIPNIKNLDIQIENLFKEEDILINEENINLAKDFIKQEIEISKENFNKFEKLTNIKNENINNILEKGAKNIIEDKNIFNIDLLENIEEYKQYKDLLPNIDEVHIQNIIDKKIPINLKNIAREYKENNKLENIKITEKAVLEKLNIAKIQMKLTMENIYTLSKNGISIDTKPLQQVIETLENTEDLAIKQQLALTNTDETKENIATIKDTFNTIKNFYPNKIYKTFKDIVDKKVDFSLSGIKDSLKTKKILEDFENFKTVPNKSFGDNLNNIKGDFENLLNENGFEPTNINIKALKILSLNNIDFTQENLLKVKTIDEKIAYVHNNLHPLLVGKMLKDGFNPMEKTIDDVINYIEKTENNFGQTSREKIAQQILQIDTENKLSKEERNAIVSVYRMLNLVEKGESASIGNILKSEKNITFKNLLEASKIYDKKQKNITFEKIVDANTGKGTKNNNEKNIISSIDKGIEKANLEYNQFILKQMVNNINPTYIAESLNNNINENIENILENSKQLEKNANIANIKNEILDDIKKINNIDQNTLNYLVKNNLPITLNNIDVLEKNIKESLKPANSIEDFKNELENREISFGKSVLDIEKQESLTKEELLKTVDNLKQENTEVFDDIINLEDLNDIKFMILKNKNVSSSIKFLQDNNNIKNGLYSLPLKLSDGKITDFNMYILNDTALNDKNLNLYLNFTNIKNEQIQAYIKTTENGKFANILANNDLSFANIKNYEKDILKILEKFNLQPDKIVYNIEEEKNIFKENFKEEINHTFDTKFNEII